jgi:AcrR family transcriptional regulator
LAIVVDKEQKRRDIALACKDVIIKSGVQEPTIATLAKSAGIGKGTFYEYFKSKDELLFELVYILMQQHNASLQERLESAVDTKEKCKIFAHFFYDPQTEELRRLYKMFSGITLLHSHKEMKQFQTQCFDAYYEWFAQIIDEGIAKGELKADAKSLAKGMFATAKGLFIASETTNSIEDLQQELEGYIETIFKLISAQESI